MTQDLQWKDPESSLQDLSDRPFTCSGIHVTANLPSERSLVLSSALPNLPVALILGLLMIPASASIGFSIQAIHSTASIQQCQLPSPATFPHSTCLPVWTHYPTFGADK